MTLLSMTKRVLFAAIGVFGLGFSLFAQRTTDSLLRTDDTFTPEELRITGEIDTAPALALYRSGLFSTVDGSVLLHGLPVLALLDGRRFPVTSAMGQMGITPLDLFPIAFLSAVQVQKVGSSPRRGSDAVGGIVDMRLNRMTSGGEVGVFYGKSGGKYGREDMSAHIIGGVGNDKFQITAGAAYHESSGRRPRYGP